MNLVTDDMIRLSKGGDMVAKDLSDLPQASRDAGNPPTSQPEFVNAVAESWYQQ